MKLKINDRIAVLDDDLEGKVVRIEGEEIVVETTEGFLLVFSENELVLIDEPLSQVAPLIDGDIAEILKEKEKSKKKGSTKPRTKERKIPPMEVDLHIHKLVNSTKGMTNHDMLTLQLDTAERQLKFAVEKRIQRIVFIHGVGEGVLKTELDYLLSRYNNIDYYDADYQKYGIGATEVFIKQNS